MQNVPHKNLFCEEPVNTIRFDEKQVNGPSTTFSKFINIFYGARFVADTSAFQAFYCKLSDFMCFGESLERNDLQSLHLQVIALVIFLRGVNPSFSFGFLENFMLRPNKLLL